MRFDTGYIKKNGIIGLLVLLHGLGVNIFDIKEHIPEIIDTAGLKFLRDWCQIEVEESETRSKLKKSEESKLLPASQPQNH